MRLLAAFRKRGLPLSLGVVPFMCERIADPAPQELAPLGQAKADLLKPALAAGEAEVFMHAYAHQVRGDPALKQGEFIGMPMDEMVRRLSEGKRRLDSLFGRPVDLFAPAWDQYDAATARALEQAGFKALSARMLGPRAPETGLRFIPTTCGLKDVGAALDLARGVSPPPTLVVTFHAYDFREVDPKRGITGFADFEALLDRLAATPDVRVTTFAALLASVGEDGQGYGHDRFAAFQDLLQSPFLTAAGPLGPKVMTRGFPGYYPEAGSTHALGRRLHLTLLALYLPLLLISAAALRLIPLGTLPPRLLAAGFILLASALLIRQLQSGGELVLRKTLLAVLLLGGCLGLLMRKSPGRRPVG